LVAKDISYETVKMSETRTYQVVEKRHERRQDKAKSNEKAEFMCDK
jgi:hypothetical protein